MTKKELNRVQIVQGDITVQNTDAIINAANTSLLGGGGVDGAIHRAAGPQLLEECRKIGGCPTGEARITKGYNLPARYVIHTVGPIYRGKAKDETLLTSCYENCFKLAAENHILSLAFPAISCGIYGYPIRDACRIALSVSLKSLKQYSFLEKIVFVLFSSQDLNVYNSQFSALK